MKTTITIIDYGVGNVHSIANALSALNYSVKISKSVSALSNAEVLILPGVGAFQEAMQNLIKLDLIPVLENEVLGNKKPILGICLGMQLFANSSTENGLHNGLGWITGTVEKLDVSPPLSIPHVGWNSVQVVQKDPLFTRLMNNQNFYFDHSFHFSCADKFKAATCCYGSSITAAVQHNNIFGVQFHPEKSQINGLRLLKGIVNSIQEITS